MTAKSNGIGIPERPPVGQRPTRKERDQGKRKVRGSTLKVSTQKKEGRTKSGRYIEQENMQELIEAVAKRDGFTCIGARLGYEHECRGQMQALHCVDQKTLGANHPALTDPAISVYGCQLLNAWLDNWRGPLVNVAERQRFREKLGVEFEDAVYRHDLELAADRKFLGAA
ncbi:MAG: hypothetical protein ACPHCI_03890 [Solirubrobacterales bacterium]